MPDLKITLEIPSTSTSPASALTRLDLALLPELQKKLGAEFSRARLKELFHQGAVRLSAEAAAGSTIERPAIALLGRPATASLQLSPGSYEVTIEGVDFANLLPKLAKPSTRGVFQAVLHEDADLLVLDKSSGVPSVPLTESETETAVGAALAHSPRLAEIGRRGLEPGLLHRLDTGTSGLLVFAKSQASFEFYLEAWRSKKVRKTYRAIAAALPGPLKDQPRTARLRLAHDAQKSKLMRAVTENTRPSAIRGKPLDTVTHIAIHCSLPHAQNVRDARDYRVEIETGVMHQIRCTFAHLGSPLWGDPIYGGLSSSRLWLHAWKLELPLMQGGLLHLESPLPLDWPR